MDRGPWLPGIVWRVGTLDALPPAAPDAGADGRRRGSGERRGVAGNVSNGYLHATLGGLRPCQMSPRSIRPLVDSPNASYQTGLVSNSMQNGLSSDRASTG